MKRNALWIIIGVVVIAAVAGGVKYAVSHKSTNKTTTSTTSTNTGSASQPNTSSASGTIIQTKSDSTVGSYLADSNSKALYTYGGDTAGVSNCTGSCLYSWPIYQASSSSTSLPANVTVITRADGTMQYAYKGLPLYTFTSDSAGQVSGNNVSNFHIAKP